MKNDTYTLVALIVGSLTFVCSWIFFIITYGVWGVFLGWLPSAVLAAVLGFGWYIIFAGLWVAIGIAIFLAMLVFFGYLVWVYAFHSANPPLSLKEVILLIYNYFFG